MTENKLIFSFSKMKNVENDGGGMMKHKIKIIKFKKMDDGKNREIIISTMIVFGEHGTGGSYSQSMSRMALSNDL